MSALPRYCQPFPMILLFLSFAIFYFLFFCVFVCVGAEAMMALRAAGKKAISRIVA